MPVAELLSRYVVAVRDEIDHADYLRRCTLLTNAVSALRMLEGCVERPEDLREALRGTHAAIATLSETLARYGQAARLEEPEIARAREDAHKAVDRLMDRLATARPNEKAKSLG